MTARPEGRSGAPARRRRPPASAFLAPLLLPTLMTTILSAGTGRAFLLAPPPVARRAPPFNLRPKTTDRPPRWRALSSPPSSLPPLLADRSDRSSEDPSPARRTATSRVADSFRKAGRKFRARPGTYLLIPFIAAFVGWFTNWLAVQMIFYPVEYRGLSLFRVPEVPLGFLGWQGIVPCKTRRMSETMVEMVTTQLLDVGDVFRRLDPRRVADLLAPEVPKLGQSVLDDVVPKFASGVPRAVFEGLPSDTVAFARDLNHRFLRAFTVGMQDNIESLVSIKNCVVEQMMADRSLLGQLFQRCGQKELDFLTNSGLWIGFLLGLIQMVVALFWENPWTLSIGGFIVGLATNWVALKFIFLPVNPTRIGPFVLQGMFLKRQKEVAAEVSFLL